MIIHSMKPTWHNILIAMVLTVLTGCWQEEVVHPLADEAVPVGFEGEYVGNPTRTEMTTAWMEMAGEGKFGVYGYKTGLSYALFNNEKVDYVDGKTWTHTTVRYWDKAAEDAYSFYAYCPYRTTDVSFNASTGFTFSGQQIFYPIADGGTEDICVAEAHQNKDYADYHGASMNGRVPFSFHHILSKLTFQFKKGQDVEAKVTVTDVKIGFPTCKSWTWNQTDNTDWDGGVSYNGYAESGGTTSLTLPAAELETTVSEATPSFIVVPGSTVTTSHAMNMTVTYQLQYSDGIKDTHTKTVSIGSIPFAQNTQYIITATISPQAINFEASALNNWTDDPIAIELQEDSTTP